MESRLHAIPGIVTGPAALPRSAPGSAIVKRIGSEVAATNCRRVSATTHRGNVRDEIPVRKWTLLAAIDRVRVRGGAVRGALLARFARGHR